MPRKKKPNKLQDSRTCHELSDEPLWKQALSYVAPHLHSEIMEEGLKVLWDPLISLPLMQIYFAITAVLTKNLAKAQLSHDREEVSRAHETIDNLWRSMKIDRRTMPKGVNLFWVWMQYKSEYEKAKRVAGKKRYRNPNAKRHLFKLKYPDASPAQIIRYMDMRPRDIALSEVAKMAKRKPGTIKNLLAQAKKKLPTLPQLARIRLTRL